ncbi:Uncharacterised protein [BD1-7 clade bacterium]|uniref:Phage major tail tube protein n=1 Tax=BD1-7 clade bacterium TaxID=2029982 RepID=A0A5S9Q1W1_9GAMM|nr:Uncharacterised protein [BD1-7 clade bacterium]CAA0111829.1 Uncharacterised protein [BD1-7 clade bacterium]
MNKLPEKLKGFALYVEGRGYAGRCSEVTLPKLTRKTEDYQAGGMDGPVEIDMGVEKLTMSYVLEEYNPDIIKLWGITKVDGQGIRIKGSVKADDRSGDEIPLEIIARGRNTEMDPGAWKKGDGASMKVQVALTEVEIIYNGESILHNSILDSVDRAGDEDRLASRRKNLGY